MGHDDELWKHDQIQQALYLGFIIGAAFMFAAFVVVYWIASATGI